MNANYAEREMRGLAPAPQNMTKVIYYTNESGENPVDDFLNSLEKSQQRKLIRIFVTIQTYGLTAVISHTKRLVGLPLWEIRILGRNNIRVLYASITEGNILLLHGFVKKSQQTSRKEINTALNRLNDYLVKDTV